MIFAIAIFLGLIAGLILAKVKSNEFVLPRLKNLWIILLGFLPQALIFFVPVTRDLIPDQLVPAILIGSQLILLTFVWFNRKQTGIWIMGIGLLLNLIVISVNKGWMPISPETLNGLQVSPETWQVWQRHGYSKDMVIPLESTRIWFLSDVFRINFNDFYKVAFSLGDIMISGGIFTFLLNAGRSEKLIINKEYAS